MRPALALELAGVVGAAALRVVAGRARRGPLRPDWSLRTELTAATIRAFVLRSKRRGIPWLREAQAALRLPSPLADRVAFEPTTRGGVPVLAARPREGEPRRVVVHLHGGGYVIGSPDGYRDTLARLALDLGAEVVSADYRLAPEHPFPAAQDDALAVTRAVLSAAPAERVGLVGDSAGGALCVATLCSLRDAGETLPAAAALLCPWTDPLAEGGSLASNADADFGDRDVLVGWIRAAAGDADPRDPRLTVAAARLEGLPPLLVQAGGGEILLDPIRAFAARAEQAGVETRLRIWGHLFHDFQMAASQLPEGAAAMEEVTGFLHGHLAGAEASRR